MKTTRKFWPLDYDQEVEIYENPLVGSARD